MEKEKETRDTKTILTKPEQAALKWLLGRLPRWVTPDMMTVTGLAGALLVALGYALTRVDRAFLAMASVGYAVNWLGDSLDGTLARYRHEERPLFGFFIDHNIDTVTVFLIGIGAGLSPYLKLSTSLLIVTGYFMMSILTYINTYLTGVFKISYGMLGPSEFRVIMILFNSGLYFFHNRAVVTFKNFTGTVFDVLGVGIAVFLYGLFLFYFIRGLCLYHKRDPRPRS
ncbi:CDP-alcohol phosphatidyltransferase family protein [Candidatus Mcinerneyibacteriota bacterium]|nr:CDP-alcohol phosphatidyltransferase family protein [Candidatus Mcinerneyibacteriota bacterium]